MCTGQIFQYLYQQKQSCRAPTLDAHSNVHLNSQLLHAQSPLIQEVCMSIYSGCISSGKSQPSITAIKKLRSYQSVNVITVNQKSGHHHNGEFRKSIHSIHCMKKWVFLLTQESPYRSHQFMQMISCYVIFGLQRHCSNQTESTSNGFDFCTQLFHGNEQVPYLRTT